MVKKAMTIIFTVVLFNCTIFISYALDTNSFVNVAADEVGVSFIMDPCRDYYVLEEIKYGQWFNSNRSDFENFVNGSYYLHESPWCVIFVSWCSSQADAGIPMYASVTDMKSWYENNCRYHDWLSYDPKAGDVVFFSREGNYSHVGIVESAETETDKNLICERRIKLKIIEGDVVLLMIS